MSEKKKDKKGANYYTQGLVGPIINGASDCLKKNTRCVPRNWNPLAQCNADADNAKACADCADFDDTFQRCMDGDDTYENVKNTWVPNPDYVQSCFKISDGLNDKPSLILTNGLSELSPFYREYDPCWFADDPTDVRCTCKILDLAAPDNTNGGMCGGSNYVYQSTGAVMPPSANPTGEGCYADSSGKPIEQDKCTVGDLKINRLSHQSPWRQEGNPYKDKDTIPRNVACAWIPSSMYNVGDGNESKSTLPEGLQPNHICGNEKQFKFRVRGVKANQPDTNNGKAPPAEGDILCGLQPVCLLNGDTIAHNDGKCYGPDGTTKSCRADSDCDIKQNEACSKEGKCYKSCQVDSDCNINKNEVCRGNPVTNKCGSDSDCEKGADFWGNIIPAYGKIRDWGWVGDKKYPFTCRKANQYPWRQYLRASKCTYLPSTSDEDAKSRKAGGVGFLKDVADGISLGLLGVPLGSALFGDPDKDAKEQLQRSKDRYSKITPMQSLQFSKDQQKLDADMIQFSKESSDLLKATEEAAQQQIEFMVKENTLFISILAVLLLLSIVFELI
jgi:hypothetical protein